MCQRMMLALAAFLSFTTSFAHGQGVLININAGESMRLPRPYYIHQPRVPVAVSIPASTYKIKELAVQVKLSDQVARTQVSQSFVNTGSAAMEVCFVFPLPYDGAIDQLTLLVDGKEMPARLLESNEARRIYEEIMRKNRDPALLEWMGSGMFKTSVFPVPPGAERKVTLRYSQLCRKDQGLTDYLFPLSTAKYTSHPVEKISFQVAIESGVPIKNVYSPTHSVEVKRPDDKHATVAFTASDQIPSSDFRLLYDVGKGQVGASVVSYRPAGGDDGYFLLLAGPDVKAADQERPKKTVLFVVDRSGSMTGPKIEQAKAAIKFVLNNLREGDLFNIIAYDSQIESYRPELQKFNDETRKSAQGFVEGLYAGGSTNISGALKTAMAQLTDSGQPTYVIFLTDGLPTDGETNETKIVSESETNNKVHARLFAFGVGYDVNSRLLDKLVRANFGQSEYVRPNEDIEARVSSLYARIGSPVMTDVSIKFDVEGAKTEEGPVISRMYPASVHDLFAGEQLVIVGRYKKPGAAKVVVTGKVGRAEQKFDFPASLAERSPDETNVFVEKLWAVRRVGEIIDQIDLKGKNDELVKELVQLSTKHGIMTPYTSFLAEEKTDRFNLGANEVRARSEVESLSLSDGAGGFSQRRAKGALQRAAIAPATKPVAEFYAASEDKTVTVDTLQTVGGKSFYRRGGQWIDADITQEQEKKAIHIERFSNEYFDLAKRLGKDAARYMAIDEPVIVELDGQTYSF